MIKRQKKEYVPKSARTPRINLKKDYRFSYKDTEMLKNFVSAQGMILSRDKTGLTQKQQRQLAVEIKRARHLALLPFTQTI